MHVCECVLEIKAQMMISEPGNSDLVFTDNRNTVHVLCKP